MNLNGNNYYYIRNAEGDIIGLIDGTGTQVVSYTYDTWGKLISIGGSLKDTVGVLNPYRYRGYRYDTETGLYYLKSRYYNPDWGRFVNEDTIAAVTGDVLSTNMYTYCANNPINMSDEDGDRPIFSDSIADETDEMRAASLACMSSVNMNRYEENQNILFYKEHTNNARPSTEEKHQKGQTRKQRDSGGEKGDARRRPNPNKHRNQNIEMTPTSLKLSISERVLMIGGGALLIGGTLIEDVGTGGAGIADDPFTLSSGGGLIIRAFDN
ncbi:RHS repeat-associated core domain-containing protein [Clostridium sp. DMHC 10]|uniref:RHS repeat-associated core domain-containing protein n=1 Tax=Clostridium sp. DMHC 10 TaxID=747377 RepID=UPI0009FFB002|nr:RHS repeat-associated core domain-containing protein [Clostridium sp. DMHC 10]